jgi:hypothetical protein
MSNGQADQAPDASDDLIQFLADNPEADAPVAGEEEADVSEDPSEEEDKSDEEEESPDDEVKASEAAKDQTSYLKFKVPVKGEDGVESTVEVDQKELIAGYQRHQDYTRKTMALADQEREVTEAVSAKLARGQEQLAEQAQLAHAAIQQIAGILSPQQMAQLAQSDPAAWVQEQQRQAHVNQVLNQLQGMTQQQKAALANQQAEAVNAQRTKAWDVLSKEGIDKPKLKGIFDTMISKYGETPERLSQLYDPTIVKIMRDAAAYQELLTKKASVVKKVAEAPKLPPQRQSVPKSEQAQRDIAGRFRSGRAKLGDLAAFIANS